MPEATPTREEFVKEVIAAFREAGLEGDLAYDETLGSLHHPSGIGFGVHDLYEKMGTLAREKRLGTLANVAHGLVAINRAPRTWADAKDKVLPELKRRMDVAIESTRRSPREDPKARPTAEITPHLVAEVVLPLGPGVNLSVAAETYATWSVPVDEVFRTAARNLQERSTGQWQASPEAPGMVRSPWRDGFDASRVMLPRVFGVVPMRGRPVVVAPQPSMLLFADSENEEGLLSLARFARKVFEHEGRFFVLRPIRLGEDGESWEDWLPPKEHPAHDGLRLLRAIEEKADYDRQIHLVRTLAGPRAPDPSALPPLWLLRSGDGKAVTMTPWRAGRATSLPKADAVLLQRGEERLGVAWWDDLLRALPNGLEPLPTYPVRYLAADFPEPWQLDGIDLHPFEGPTPDR